MKRLLPDWPDVIPFALALVIGIPAQLLVPAHARYAFSSGVVTAAAYISASAWLLRWGRARQRRKASDTRQVSNGEEEEVHGEGT